MTIPNVSENIGIFFEKFLENVDRLTSFMTGFHMIGTAILKELKKYLFYF